MDRFAALARTHDTLNGLLEEHLHATVLGDLEAAREAWHAFAALLRAHADAEEALLMPRFSALRLATTGCSEALLHAEHDKLRALLARGDRRVNQSDARLDAATRVAWVRACHVLLELLDHHDQRERVAFFPALDEALDPDERDTLLAAFRAREAAVTD